MSANLTTSNTLFQTMTQNLHELNLPSRYNPQVRSLSQTKPSQPQKLTANLIVTKLR